MKNIVVIFLFVTLAFPSFGQTPNGSLFNRRYKSHSFGLELLLKNKIIYPRQSIDNSIIGVSITSLELTPQGTIEEIKIINSLDPFIDGEVMSVLRSTENSWKPDSLSVKNEILYFQIVFYLTWVDPEPDFYSPINHPRFLDPILISGFKEDLNLILDDTLLSRYQNHIFRSEYLEALEQTNELVRRNPYNLGLLQLRLFNLKKLNRRDLMSEELDKMSSFADGKSLDDIVNKHYDYSGNEITMLEYDVLMKSDTLYDNIYIEVENMPTFKGGGVDKFRNWVTRNVKYPQRAAELALQGKVFIMFVVEVDGSVSNVMVLRGVHPLLDNEAKRVVESSPKWEPGYDASGNLVRVRFSITVAFSLE